MATLAKGFAEIAATIPDAHALSWVEADSGMMEGETTMQLTFGEVRALLHPMMIRPGLIFATLLLTKKNPWFLNSINNITLHISLGKDPIACTLIMVPSPFLQLAATVDAVAHFIKGNNLQPGERLLLCFPPGPNFLVAMVACFVSGVIAGKGYMPVSFVMPRSRSCLVDRGLFRRILSLIEYISIVKSQISLRLLPVLTDFT